MFSFFKNKCQNNSDESRSSIVPKISLEFLNRNFCIDTLDERESDDDYSGNNLLTQRIADIKTRINDVEAALIQYVEKHYFSLIEENYLYIKYTDKTTPEYEDSLLLKEDYENKTTLHTEAFLRNIKLVYFSVLDEKTSYLFFYINNSDSLGMDIILTPDSITIKEHE